MPRLPEIDEAKLSPDQRRLYDEIKRVRGQVRGPFAVWLRNPELAEYTLKLGISPEIVEAIRERRTPNFVRDDERLVYDITMELNTTHSLSEVNYSRGTDMFGEQKIVELVSAVGFYSMVAMTLNAFDVSVPGDKRPLD